ncbi:MAG: hypothetical protein RLZZ387_3447 [Chloroflexota bacterium]|jgi:ATP-dependent DNA helicase RecG
MSDPASLAERRPVPGASLEDLDLNLIRAHIATAIERRGYDGPADPAAYLVQKNAVAADADGRLTPTVVGVVAFAREPERWLASSGVDVTQFSTTKTHSTDIVFSRQMRGTITTLIDRVVDLLWARTEHRSRLVGSERIEEDAYPLVVLRELTANALAHRDWQIEGARVRIQIFPDRIEWSSPGGLPPGITAATLRDEQVSRNPYLAQILYEAGKIESFGLGIDTVEDTLRAWGCPPLQVQASERQVTMGVVAKRLAPVVVAQTLTLREAEILALIDQRGPLTITEIAQSLTSSRRTLQYDLRKLVERGDLVVKGATNNRRYYRPAQLEGAGSDPRAGG